MTSQAKVTQIRRDLLGHRNSLGIYRMSNEIHKTGSKPLSQGAKYCIKMNNIAIFKHLQVIDKLRQELFQLGKEEEL